MTEDIEAIARRLVVGHKRDGRSIGASTIPRPAATRPDRSVLHLRRRVRGPPAHKSLGEQAANRGLRTTLHDQHPQRLGPWNEAAEQDSGVGAD